MKRKRYFSQRNNKSKGSLSRLELKNFLLITIDNFYEKKYFCEKLKLNCCVDEEEPDISSRFYKETRNNVWGIFENRNSKTVYIKDDLFDLIEFLFTYISKPTEKKDLYHHNFANCGYHYNNYSMEDGQKEFRDDINDYLIDFEGGYILSENGEIVLKPDLGLSNLLIAKKIDFEKGDIKNRMINAEKLFYSRVSTIDDRKNAVRELADCFEYLKPDLRNILDKKDESDLFNIANNFSIRHHNSKQKNNYDKNIWLSWMFHFYLATLHASLRLIKIKNKSL